MTGFARWVDSSISKTVNIPEKYTFEDFKNLYLNAFNSGYIKGLTSYRANTMTNVLSSVNKNTNDKVEEIIKESIKLPNAGKANYDIIRAEGHKWYLTTILNEDETSPVALFVVTNTREPKVTTHDAIEKLLNLAKEKGIPIKWIQDVENKINIDNNSTKIARTISLCLRHGILVKNVVSVLDSIENVFVGTFLFQIRKHLSKWIKNGEKIENKKCPNCGSEQLVYQEGCSKCLSCGHSACT
jgi:ribonucleoside-diphosphate reductase alpha chain